MVDCAALSPTLLRLGELIVNGLALGSLMALGSVGLTLTYGILRLPNFAHGDFMTLGAYLILAGVQWKLSLPLAFGLGLLATIVLGIGIDQTLWLPLRQQRATSTTVMISSLGLSLVLRSAILLIWGPDNQSYGLPLAEPFRVACVPLLFYQGVIMALALLLLLALHGLLTQTSLGKAMRAVADNPDLAAVTGIDVNQIIRYTWILSLGITAAAGGLYGLVSALRPSMGWFLILPLFAAVILGGIGNPYGAIVAALGLGVIQQVSTYWLPNEYQFVVALVVMMVGLLIRPQGLFRGLL